MFHLFTELYKHLLQGEGNSAAKEILARRGLILYFPFWISKALFSALSARHCCVADSFVYLFLLLCSDLNLCESSSCGYIMCLDICWGKAFSFVHSLGDLLGYFWPFVFSHTLQKNLVNFHRKIPSGSRWDCVEYIHQSGKG